MSRIIFILFLPFLAVILLPWRLQINSIIAPSIPNERVRSLLASSLVGVVVVVVEDDDEEEEKEGGTTSHLSCDWFPLVMRRHWGFLFFSFFSGVSAGGEEGGRCVRGRAERTPPRIKSPARLRGDAQTVSRFQKGAARQNSSRHFRFAPTTLQGGRVEGRKEGLTTEHLTNTAKTEKVEPSLRTPVRFHHQPDWQQLWIHVCFPPSHIPVSNQVSLSSSSSVSLLSL